MTTYTYDESCLLPGDWTTEDKGEDQKLILVRAGYATKMFAGDARASTQLKPALRAVWRTVKNNLRGWRPWYVDEDADSITLHSELQGQSIDGLLATTEIGILINAGVVTTSPTKQG